MGLTIHYTIEAPKTWTHNQIFEKLQAAQQFAKTLEFEEVSEVQEFKDEQCDFQWLRDHNQEKNDEFFWAKIQACRHIDLPWKPGCSRGQSPNRMMVFSVWPDKGCEQMNIGICSFPRLVIEPDTKCDYLNWSHALDKYASPEQKKIIKAFMKKWNLRKLRETKGKHTYWSKREVYSVEGWWAIAGTAQGRYKSHRKGYEPDFGIVTFRDQMKHNLQFKYNGTAEEAIGVFSSEAFQSDLRDMVYGKETIIPAEFGKWRSFCKTQYAENFLKSHLGVCAMLEKLQELGFKVNVNDEGDFWTKRDVKALVVEVAEWDAMIAAAFGAMKDALPNGLTLESPITERPDFEHLEMKGQGKIAKFLEALNACSRKENSTNP